MKNLDAHEQELASVHQELKCNLPQCATLQECVVCGSSAYTNHSSVLACNACA
ncbi:hypothetical protein AAVH_32890, partial [Aphelenchoides avenae]